MLSPAARPGASGAPLRKLPGRSWLPEALPQMSCSSHIATCCILWQSFAFRFVHSAGKAK